MTKKQKAKQDTKDLDRF